MATVCAALLVGCTESGGNGYAASLAERVAIAVGDDITPAYNQSRSAEYLAARAIESPRLPSTSGPTDIAVDVLGWEGESSDSEGARIDLRVDVHVVRQNSVHIGDPGVQESFSTRCWTLTVLSRNYDNYALDEVDCEEDAVAKVPSPDPLPEMPDDVEERFATALAEATLQDAPSRLEEAFPDDFYDIEVNEFYGEIVTVVGISNPRDCALGVRQVDGSVVTSRGFGREQLKPGEGGCSTRLYTPAPRDSGPRAGAQGEATAGERGAYLYTVVAGDIPSEIQNRFALYSLGQIKNTEGQSIGNTFKIIEGEQLTIAP